MNREQEDEIRIRPNRHSRQIILVQSNEELTNEINFRDVCFLLWKKRAFILIPTLVFAIFGTAYSLSLPNYYKSETLLAPVNENEANALSAVAGQLGGLASLAGININPGGSDRTNIVLAVLQSREFIKHFINLHNLKPALIAAKGWDNTTEQLLFDPDIFDEKSKIWVRSVSPPQTTIPSDYEAFTAFSDMLQISRDDKNGLVKISLSYLSPNFAKTWLDWLVTDLNEYIRKDDLTEAEKTKSYLEEQLKETSVSDMQTIFYQLIEEQTKTIMLAKVRDNYALKTLDPPTTPEEKAGPRRSLICLMATSIGFFLSCVFVLTYPSTNRN